LVKYQLYQAVGDVDSACAAQRTALALAPNSPKVLEIVLWSLIDKGNTNELILGLDTLEHKFEKEGEIAS